MGGEGGGTPHSVIFLREKLRVKLSRYLGKFDIFSTDLCIISTIRCSKNSPRQISQSQPIQSTYSFECSKPFNSDLKQIQVQIKTQIWTDKKTDTKTQDTKTQGHKDTGTQTGMASWAKVSR